MSERVIQIKYDYVGSMLDFNEGSAFFPTCVCSACKALVPDNYYFKEGHTRWHEKLSDHGKND